MEFKSYQQKSQSDYLRHCIPYMEGTQLLS